MTDKIEQEKEYKFLTNPSAIATILNLTDFAGSKRTNLDFFQQVDFYYDTPNLFFYHQGLQFRIRKTESDLYQATLKLPSGTQKEVYDRTEHNTQLVLAPEFFQVPDFDRSQVSPQLEKKLASLISQENLYLALKVVNERKIIALENKLLVFLDNVTFLHPEHQTTHQEYEVEIEAGPASLKDLHALAHYLQKQYGLIPSPNPKYQRGLSKFIKKQ